MEAETWKTLDQFLRLRLAQMPSHAFERFFLDYFQSGVTVTISRDGKAVTKRVISAEMWGGPGRDQEGIDLRLNVEDREVWAVQCKRVKSWTVAQTKAAIAKAEEFAANHYILAVACDTGTDVQTEINAHPKWTLWNLETICSNLRLHVSPVKRRDIVWFLGRDEVKRFLPFHTSALISPEAFFEKYTGDDKPLRHDWPMAGRETELKRMADWAEGRQKILLVSARGGEGKTRLARAFCEEIKRTDPKAEVLFLNPFREDSDFSLAPHADAPRRFIIIDDAHRVDLVPQALLDQIRLDPTAKLVLLSRPQGRDSIGYKLIDTGFEETTVASMMLPSLKGPAARRLAAVVLGDAFKNRLSEFLKLTENNPFLITTAGSLLLNRRLIWGSWNNHAGFRRRVFEEFETENLATIPDAERPQARQLLRLLAMLSPVAHTTEFVERAESVLPPGISIERLINFLRLVELVVGSEQGLRVSPDLYADFLVYETCFDPKNREKVWTERVLNKFVDHGAVLIRNISEASWIAQLNGVSDDKVLEPLMAWQRDRFQEQSFVERSATLRYWTSFSQYLPKQSLEMAELAIQEKQAPPDPSLGTRVGTIDCYPYLLTSLPALLRPVAKYHLDYSHQALDILWQLGCAEKRPEHNNQNHPWTVIAEVFKYEASKPVAYNLSALDWLAKLINTPEGAKELEQPTPVLRLFLGPCFSRVVDGSYVDGRTIHFVEQHVRLGRTQVVRDRAMEILDSIIERGPALAVLDALSALEVAIQRIGLAFQRRLEDSDRYVIAWRPERLKALKRYEVVIQKYPDVVLRYEIRRTLKRDVIYEEDAEFAAECRRILDLIPDDLRLRTAVALTPDFAYEFEEDFQDKANPERFGKSRERWFEEVQKVADALATAYPTAAELYPFLNSIVSELTAGGFPLNQHLLLTALGVKHWRLGCDLAHEILASRVQTTLLQNWPALIDNVDVPASEKLKLFEKAVKEKVEGARVAVIRHLSGEAQQKQPLDAKSQELLFEIAESADAKEAIYLYQLIEHSSEENLQWAFRLLEMLTRQPVEQSLLGACLAALTPFQRRSTLAPRSLVQHVFKQLITVPDLGFYQHGHNWEEMKKLYAPEVYALLCQRVEHAKEEDNWEYTPIPHALEGRLRLPELTKTAEIGAIVDDLWKRSKGPASIEIWMWIKLFQGVVMEDERFWYDRFVSEVAAATTEDELERLVQLISFEGSLVVFSYPKITEAILGKAQAIGGDEFFSKTRWQLHGGSGPTVRGFTNGELDKEYDYLEAAALKAAEKHADSQILGPFYRWMVETEQKDRLFHKLRADEDAVME
jgi:hypothetical protein